MRTKQRISATVAWIPVWAGCLLAPLNALHAQTWVEMLEDPNKNFYEIQAAFNSYWEGRTIEKGQGYSAFRRWEYFMEPRVYPSGDRSLPFAARDNYAMWLEERQREGVSRSPAGNWSAVGPAGSTSTFGNAGRINCIRFDPANSNIMYAGAPNGGLWKTTNGGTSWTTQTDDLAAIGCADLAIHPSNSQTLYLATGDNNHISCYSIGVLKSTDGGNTWNNTGLSWTTSQLRSIYRLLIHPTNPQILIAFTSLGIYRTTDGGTTWTSVSNSIMQRAHFKPGNPNIVYACGATLMRSADAGVTWTTVNTGLTGVGRMVLAVTPANPDYVYVLATQSTTHGFLALLRSDDSGLNFSTRMAANGSNNIVGGQGWYDLALAASPTNAEEIISGGISIWRSTDGGTSFSQHTGGYHVDIHDLQFVPGSGTTFMVGNDGGVFRFVNNNGTWQGTDLSNSLAIGQQYQMGVSEDPAAPYKILAGHQDNNVQRYDGTNWASVGGGDGMYCFWDKVQPNILYFNIQYGSCYKNIIGGTWTNMSAGLPTGSANASWVCPFHPDPVDANVLYTGGRTALYRYTHTSGGWTALGTPAGTTKIIDFAISPSNNQIIYTIKTGTTPVSKSTDGGLTFMGISNGLPANIIPSDVTVSATDSDVAFITCSAHNAAAKVFKTTDGGATWANISAGLPNVPFNTVVHVTHSIEDAIYVGSDFGVYYRDNSTAGWIPFENGLPNVAVTDLEIHYGSGLLRAATYGRGTWESDLYDQTAYIPQASFTAADTVICTGDTAHFTNTSSGNPANYQWLFPGGIPASSTDESPIVLYPNSGTYTVQLVATTGSISDTAQTVTIIIEPLPVVSCTPLDTVCQDAAPFMLAGGAPTGGTYSGAGVSGGIFDPQTAGTGSHSITYTVSENDCINSITTYIVVTICTGTSTVPTDGIAIYPNPSDGKITLEGNKLQDFEKLTVLNVLGQVVASSPIPSATLTLSLEALPVGTYTLQLHPQQTGKPYYSRTLILTD